MSSKYGGGGYGGGGKGGGGYGGSSFSFAPEALKKVRAGDGETTVSEAEKLARAIDRVSKARIRGFYQPIVEEKQKLLGVSDVAVRRETEVAILSRLHLLRARLAYLEKRDGSAAPLRAAWDQLVQGAAPEHLQGIFDFCEALVAYHYSVARN